MIIIDRKSGMNALRQIKAGAQAALEQKRPIILFPEGTRTAPEQKVQYKSGIKFLHDTFIQVPVVPIALNSGKYWLNKRLLKRSGIIKVKILPRIEGQGDFVGLLQRKIDTTSDEL